MGFTFNSKGDVSTQVGVLCRKFRQKVWALRHLRKSNFTEDELIKVYKTYIRPTVEYSSPVYHPMLTAEQTYKLEKLQYFALKNIYGFQYSHRQLLDFSKIPTLQQRREEMTKKFAQKTASNPRFQHWYPQRKTGGKRGQTIQYQEKQARTDRRRNSPIFYYKRILNEGRIDYDVRKQRR